MLYVALGDSITAGEAATSPEYAYPALVVRKMGAPTRATGSNDNLVLAEPGWTSMDLLTAVREQPLAPLRHARAVSVWVGGDNLVDAGLALASGASAATLTKSLEAYAGSIGALLALLRHACCGRVIACTQYNPFPNSPMASNGIAMLNQATVTAAAAAGAAIAPVHEWFAGNQARWIAGYRTGRIQDALAGQGAPVHPNNLGHRAIAEGLTPLVLG